MNFVELSDGSRLVTKQQIVGAVKDAGKGRLQFLVSTEAVDSDGDIIHQTATDKGAGWDTAHFNKSPLLLWSHDRWVPNLSAPGTKAVPTQAGLMLDPAEFDMDDPAAAFIEGKIRRGSLREFSVGVRYKTFSPRDGGGLEVWEQELIEVSACNRGANPETAVLAKSILRGRPELIAKLESAGDPEVEELKLMLVEYENRLKSVEQMICDIGDRLAAPVGDGGDKKELADWDAAAAAVLSRMKAVGTAS